MKTNALRVFGCAALIAVGASAWAEEADPFTIEPDGVYGIVKYEGDETKVERIVAVPWVDRDAEGALCDMPVGKIITPSDLTKGDELHIWNGEKYDVYEWNGEEWVGAINVDSGELSDPSARVKRGQALWYVRKAPAGDFTLMGTIGSGECQSKVGAGTKSLFVNPYPRNIDDILAKLSGETCDGDRIVPLKDKTKPYQKKGGKWGVITPGETKPIFPGSSLIITGDDVFTVMETIEIPANQAFWYISKGGSPTINW